MPPVVSGVDMSGMTARVAASRADVIKAEASLSVCVLADDGAHGRFDVAEFFGILFLMIQEEGAGRFGAELLLRLHLLARGCGNPEDDDEDEQDQQAQAE